MNGRRATAIVPIVVCLLTVAALTCRCSQPDRGDGKPARTVRISGAEVAMPFVKALAKAYTGTNPSARFEFLPDTSSTGGLNGVAAGILDVAVVSRPLTPREESLGLRQIWLARDPVILVAHQGAPVDSLSSAQVRDIYSGRAASWKAFGGSDLRIVVVDRPERTSGKILFRESVLGADLKITRDAVVVAAADEVHAVVLSTPGAVAFTSRSLYLREKPDLSVLRLDGIYPDEDAVRSRSYPAVRPFGIAVSPTPDPAVESFASFASSPAGTAVARTMDLFPW